LILSIIAFFILLATGMHIAYGHKHDLKMDDVSPIASETLWSRTTSAITINTSLPANPIDEREQSTASDEVTPLVTRSDQAVDSGRKTIR
jgi:hypothetical protein